MGPAARQRRDATCLPLVEVSRRFHARECLEDLVYALLGGLEHLYQEHKNQGLIVFCISDEDPATQRRVLAKVPVTYPLLTYDGQIPGSLPACCCPNNIRD